MDKCAREEAISILLSALAGDSCCEVTGMWFAPVGRSPLMFLDWIAREDNGVFKDKSFVMDIINKLFEKERMDGTYDCIFGKMSDMIAPDYRDDYKRMISEEVSQIVDEIAFFMDHFFAEYLDDSLKKDRDVVMAVLEYLACLAERNGQFVSVPYICSEAPHELLMEEDVFSLLLRATDPLTIYSSVLTTEEKLNSDIIFRFAEWYVQKNAFADSGDEDIKNNYLELCREWASAVSDAAEFPKTDWLYGDKDPYTERVFEFKDMAYCFFDRIGTPMYSDATITSLVYEYEGMMRKKDEAETEDFCWHKSFENLIAPYDRQIRILSAVTLNDRSFLYTVNKVALGESLKPEDERPCMSSHNTNADDEEGSFMNIPDCDVDCQIPFNWA